MDIANVMAGFAHPLSGTDHIIAMVAIGLWGAVAGGRALWVWPLAFVSAILVGFTAATLGLRVPLVEPAIAASIVVLGVLIIFAVRAPLWLGAVIAGLFAFFHGHAHGTEALSAGAEPIAYAAGFSIATAALHAAGIATGFLITAAATDDFSQALDCECRCLRGDYQEAERERSS